MPCYVYGSEDGKRFIMVFESWNALNDDDEVPDGCTPYMYNICDSETNEELDGGFYYGYKTPDELAADEGFPYYLNKDPDA